MWRSTVGGRAAWREHREAKGRLMNIGRSGALTALALLVVLGCGGSDAKVDEGGGGTDGPQGEPSSSGGPQPPPEVAPVGGTPVDGVFVSASKGIDDGDASPNRPVKTLARAVSMAATSGLPVIACAETYPEALTIPDGIRMYGYFDCSESTWKRRANRAKIVSPTIPAVLVQNSVRSAYFEGFDVIAPDAPAAAPGSPAASSYGMIIRHTKNFHIADVSITAGAGQNATDGTEGAPNVELSTSTKGQWKERQRICSEGAVPCAVVVKISGAAGGASQCKVGPSGGPGGQGGDGPVTANRANRYILTDQEKSGKPFGAGTALTAKGAAPMGDLAATKGSNGAQGAVGKAGSNGVWAFTEAGFVPGNGTPGENGAPGQGGGGGPGTGLMWSEYNDPVDTPSDPVMWGAVGAGGGAGGCGGVAGTAGAGGGASVGLFVVASESITIDNSRIAGKSGGRGGKGTLGTIGLPGSPGGPGRYFGPGPNETRLDGLYGGEGGRGGDGGAAGLSGHGAPGPSIALVYNGERPVVRGVELVSGTGGLGSPVLARGQQSLPATVGDAKEEHSF